MAKRLRARPSNTMILIFGSGLILVLLAVAGLNKPLPSYLVAQSNLPVGQALSDENTSLVPLDLGVLAERYATKEQAENLVLLQPIAEGELIPLRLLAEAAPIGQTSIRFTPDLKPANRITIGSKVTIWQVVEIEEAFEPQLLVASALIADILYGDGLFAGELPEVEVLVPAPEGALLLSALASDASVYLLPKS